MDLMMIEEVILDGLREHAGEEKLRQLRKEAGEKLRRYKQSMEREAYEQTVDNFVAQRLREIHEVPRLSLFYL
jgi:DNA-directed RNA polymerase specialized sigma subunit